VDNNTGNLSIGTRLSRIETAIERILDNIAKKADKQEVEYLRTRMETLELRGSHTAQEAITDLRTLETRLRAIELFVPDRVMELRATAVTTESRLLLLEKNSITNEAREKILGRITDLERSDTADIARGEYRKGFVATGIAIASLALGVIWNILSLHPLGH